MRIKHFSWALFNIGLVIFCTFLTTMMIVFLNEYAFDLDHDLLKGIAVILISSVSILSSLLLLNKLRSVLKMIIAVIVFLICLSVLGWLTNGLLGLNTNINDTIYSVDNFLQVGIGAGFIFLFGLTKRKKKTGHLIVSEKSKQNSVHTNKKPIKDLRRLVDGKTSKIKNDFIRKKRTVKHKFGQLSNNVKSIKLSKLLPEFVQGTILKNKVVNKRKISGNKSNRNKKQNSSKPRKDKIKAVPGKKISINKQKNAVKNSPNRSTKIKSQVKVDKTPKISRGANAKNGTKIKARIDKRNGTTSKRIGLSFIGKKHPKVQLSKEVENRCPFCLEIVEEDDPRGIVICPICHTYHHADCWEVTGTCQVPHKHV